MARRNDKEQAIKFRRQGMSYSQIREKINVSKSTLSGWLKDMPLPKDRLDLLQRSEVVIEKIRTAKQKKRNDRLQKVFDRVSKDIGHLSKREFFIAGLFLYWAEGGKTTKYSVSLSNTDPRMIRAFITWLRQIGVPDKKIIVKLHLYRDMNVDEETKYWLKETGLKKLNFRNPYIKSSTLSSLTYTTRGHGTCNVIVNGRDVAEYVHQGLRYIESLY